MKKKFLGLFLVLTLLLTACGNSKTGNTLTPPEPGPTEAPLSDTDEARAKRAEDVRTANTIAAAVQTVLQEVYYYNCLQRDRELSVPFRMPGFRLFFEGAENYLSYGESEYPGEVGYDVPGAEQTGNDDGLGVFCL